MSPDTGGAAPLRPPFGMFEASVGWLRAGEAAGVGSNVIQPQPG